MYALPDIEVLRQRPGVVVVECKGEHDLATKDEVAELLARLVAENDLVVVDITDAKFIDCSFLHNVSKAQESSRQRGATLRLQVGTAPIVKRMLEVTNFLADIDHAPTRSEVVAGAGQ